MEVWKLIELILKSFQEHNGSSSERATDFSNGGFTFRSLRMIGREVQRENFQMVLLEYLSSHPTASKFRPILSATLVIRHSFCKFDIIMCWKLTGTLFSNMTSTLVFHFQLLFDLDVSAETIFRSGRNVRKSSLPHTFTAVPRGPLLTSKEKNTWEPLLLRLIFIKWHK